MKESVRYVMGLLVPAFLLAVVVSGPTLAQDKAKDVKAVTPDARAVKSLTSDRMWQQKARNGPELNYWP